MKTDRILDRGDTPDPGQAYRRLWGPSPELWSGHPDPAGGIVEPRTGKGGCFGPQAYEARDIAGSPDFLPARFSPLEGVTDRVARAGARAYFQANPDARRNVRDNLHGVFGSAFSDSEMNQLADGLLDKAGAGDIAAMAGLRATTPQTITADQKQAIDAIIARLPSTPLNQRAIDAYRRALANGALRIR